MFANGLILKVEKEYSVYVFGIKITSLEISFFWGKHSANFTGSKFSKSARASEMTVFI